MWERLPRRPYINLCVTDRKQVVKGEKSHKLAEITVASRHPAEGRPELDGQVVTRQKQGEGNYDNTNSTPSKRWATAALAKNQPQLQDCWPDMHRTGFITEGNPGLLVLISMRHTRPTFIPPHSTRKASTQNKGQDPNRTNN